MLLTDQKILILYSYLLNDANNIFRTPLYYYVTSKISGIETRSYSPDLKKRIKMVMTADESSD